MLHKHSKYMDYGVVLKENYVNSHAILISKPLTIQLSSSYLGKYKNKKGKLL